MTNTFLARWKGKDFECRRVGDKIEFKLVGEPGPPWRALPIAEFDTFFERVGQGSMFE
jgi:hypothetical protein